MLTKLSVKDVVLIEKCDLDFADGLCVFTGETGAGKSILLDSLSLVLGARSDTGLIRSGAKQLSVTAEFFPISQSVQNILSEASIDFDLSEPLYLRRQVTTDGKSKAYINDQPVSAGLLRQIGEELVEIHGQFATHRLLNPATHRSILDNYGQLSSLTDKTKTDYQYWKSKKNELSQCIEQIEQAKKEEDFLRHSVEELSAFKPQVGEETALQDRRTLMMNSEKIAENLNISRQALSNEEISHSLRIAQRQLSNLVQLSDKYNEIIDLIDQAMTNLSEAENMIEIQAQGIDFNPAEQEQIEERLYALHALLRKHQVSADDLPSLLEDFQLKLKNLDQSEHNVSKLEKEVEQAKQEYVKSATQLSMERHKVASKLDCAVKNELAPLKLGSATFTTKIEKTNEENWSEYGFDKVEFTASTNAGTPTAPIHKIASGGELARFMLALKVNLATVEQTPTLVFDEVDAAIGGATAFAVGERLARLAKEDCQVLVITHSPQVASFGRHHFRVEKGEVSEEKVLTNVTLLSDENRINEIARMLSGATITESSKLAAIDLLKNRT